MFELIGIIVVFLVGIAIAGWSVIMYHISYHFSGVKHYWLAIPAAIGTWIGYEAATHIHLSIG